MTSPGRVLRPLPAVLAVGIATVAIFLRFWRITWALDDGTWFPDEILWAHSAVLFTPLSWGSFVADRHLRLPYPAFYAVLTGLSLATTRVLGSSPFGSTDLDAILIARIVSAAAGVCTVGLVGLLAWRMDSLAVGLAAAALMAVVPLHVMQNHYACVDVVHTAGVALVMLAAHGVATHGTKGSALLLGAAAGMAFASKYTGLAMLVSATLVVADLARREGSVERAVDLGVWVLAGFVGAVFLACPPCVLQPDRMLIAWRWQWNFKSSEFTLNHLVPSLGWYGRPYLYQLVAALPYSLGWPLYALTLVGLLVAVRRRDVGDRVVLATVVPYFLMMGASRVTLLRYLLPVVPGLVILAARSMPARRAWPGLVALACLYSLVLSASQIARYSLESRKDLARWVATISPARDGVPVAVPERLHDYVLLTRPLAQAGVAYVRAPEGHWLESAPDVFVLPALNEAAVLRDEPEGVAAGELRRLESGALPYRRARQWRSWYLQRDFYTWLDPGFAISEGATDFTVYVRRTQ